MITFEICGSVAAIRRAGASPIDDRMIAVADCPEHSEILLYRTDDLSVRSAPLVCGVASFEERAIEPGGVYLTRIRTPGGDIDCPCFYVYESCGSLYAVRRQGSLTS